MDLELCKKSCKRKIKKKIINSRNSNILNVRTETSSPSSLKPKIVRKCLDHRPGLRHQITGAPAAHYRYIAFFSLIRFKYGTAL